MQLAFYGRNFGDWTLASGEFHFFEGLDVWGAQNATFGDDGGDVFGGRYIERGIADADAVGRELLAAVVRDFESAALLNGDGVAGFSGEIDSGPRGGGVEGDAMLPGQDCDVVCADLIGEVTVGGDTIRADDDGLDAAGAHETGGHVVADDGGGDAVGHEFPCG